MENLVIIRTLKELEALSEYLKDKDYVSFDTETTGLTLDCEIIGFSVCAELDIGYYVILSYWEVEKQKLVYLETKQGAKAFLEALASKNLIMHNAVFDCQMVENSFQVPLMPSVHTDTLILGHLLNENRSNGLKERAVELYGDDSRAEQLEMKASVSKNGGVLTKACYELYKADADLIAKYGAKDAILTLKLFYNDVPLLYEADLDKFFYEDESMPLLRGPTYDMNTTGLKVDPDKLQKLRGTLEAEILESKAFIFKEITPHIKEKYPGTGKTNVFNIRSSKQLAWLLFFQLNNEFNGLTKGGRELCKALDMKIPYSSGAKREFIHHLRTNKDLVWKEAGWNHKTKKTSNPKKIGDPWNYMACGKETLQRYAEKYKWVEKFLEHAKNTKLLSTYAIGIQSRLRYGVIRPSFLQHGTTSGRFSSRAPNFQNLPRDDKRIKACIISREGKVFVGADQSQLEPRIFTAVSQEPALLDCFAKGEDFYSVVGIPIFDKYECSTYKKDKNSFSEMFPELRNISKQFALATPYGTSAFEQARRLGKTQEYCQEIIDKYFGAYPNVRKMMLESHDMAKISGVVYNLFGRPRRIPKAMDIPKIYGKTKHSELPYASRNLLNLAMNHRVQSTAASAMNRQAIEVWSVCKKLAEDNPHWAEVKIVLQVHDELILEGPDHLAQSMALVLKDCMENAVTLPGVALVVEPKLAYNLADLK